MDALSCLLKLSQATSPYMEHLSAKGGHRCADAQRLNRALDMTPREVFPLISAGTSELGDIAHLAE
jgi:hypothetical protein